MARVRGSISLDKKRGVVDDKVLSSKKDLTLEQQTIGAFTLIFQDPNTEAKWQKTNLLRQIRLTQRLLFVSALFQGLFHWSYLVEQKETGDDHYILFLSLRLLIALVFIFGSFLIGTGLYSPNQLLLFWAQIIYGGPTIGIYCWTRVQPSQWDFLFLVYGLCFFTLPKISPLNFIYAFSGAGMFSFLFIYISAFHLSLSEWILSSTYLLVIVVLFMYISYSSERSSRERWLLRERLHREHIDLKIVASSIEEDMSKAIEDRPTRRQYNSQRSSQSTSSSRSRYTDSNSDRDQSVWESGGRSHISPGGTNEKTIVLFFKGLAAWGLVMLMGFMFDSFAGDAAGEMSNSTPFVLLLHSTGFSIFLMYFTGQVRWFVLNGIMGLCMIWLFHESGMDKRWIIFSTHSVGYVILAAVVVIMILLFGGVVLVWTHLIDFVKEILTRYPQVKEDLYQERVLEQVLIRYLSDMPSISLVNGRPSLADEEESGAVASAMEGGHGRSSAYCPEEHPSPSPSSSVTLPSRDADKTTIPKPLAKVIPSSKKKNCCYFCLRDHPAHLLQVCDGWATPVDGKGIPMCTPYAQLTQSNNDLLLQLKERDAVIAKLQCELARVEEERDVCLKNITNTKNLLSEMELTVTDVQRDKEKSVAQERDLRNRDIERIISQHNSQLAELKRLHKLSVAAERKRWEHITTSSAHTITQPVGDEKKSSDRLLASPQDGGAAALGRAISPTSSVATTRSGAESKHSEGNRKRTAMVESTSKIAEAYSTSVNVSARINRRQHINSGQDSDHTMRNDDISSESPMCSKDFPPSCLSPEDICCGRSTFPCEDEILIQPTPEDDDFNRFFLSSMNDIESIRLAIAASNSSIDSGASGTTGNDHVGGNSRMQYARDLVAKH